MSFSFAARQKLISLIFLPDRVGSSKGFQPFRGESTTFAMEYLPKVAGCTHFVNADLIAVGPSPLAPERELVTASDISD